ncbi:hypothetical protein IFR05_000391 [Cadophora sp. M221]|nr:hypothetical protein IFR05_000391 [Cadophora sp. M221]
MDKMDPNKIKHHGQGFASPQIISSSPQGLENLGELSDPSEQNFAIEPAFFSSLPFELREQIWLYTLQPRMIYLHPHAIYPPQRVDAAGTMGTELSQVESKITSLLFNHSIYSHDTTPADAFSVYAKELESCFERKGKRTGILGHSEIDPEDCKLTSPGPPAALNVCSESRSTAIRKGYVLAFRGIGVGERGIRTQEKGLWIDFQHDLIMLDTTIRLAVMHQEANTDQALQLLMDCLPEDASRIKSIALRGNLIAALRALKLPCNGPVVGGEDGEWQRFLGYPSLRHIWVDDEFHVDSPGSSHERVPSPLFLGNEQAVEEFLFARLTRSPLSVRSPSWPWGVPSIKVVRGEAWKNYF